MRKEVTSILILLLILFSFGLRTWRLDTVPPGWRDDELINSLVISQKALDGDVRVYYADASGHEGLYHILNAGFLALFGPSPFGIRLLSALLGTWTVWTSYRLTALFFNRRWLAFVAALALSLSFWSLMYSRTGIRHIALPAFVLPAFVYFWRMLHPRLSENRSASWSLSQNLDAIVGGFFLGLAFYTYFASRGAPLVFISFLMVLAWVAPTYLASRWRSILIFFGIAVVMAIPLILTLQAQPESEARVAELAVPIVEAGEGNFEPLIEFTLVTLGMFHTTGDDEFLYNIPGRPVFGWGGALLFWSGVLITLAYSLTLFLEGWRRWFNRDAAAWDAREFSQLAYPFLFLWWLAGISPGFLSVPPASLGHTILAQTPTYIIAILPILEIEKRRATRDERALGFDLAKRLTFVPLLLSLFLVSSVAWRDLPAYFVEWPNRGQTRFLYRADLRELADHAADRQLADIAIGGLLAGPWDKLAYEAYADRLDNPAVARWFDPQRVLFVSPSQTFLGYPRTLKPFDAELYQFETVTPEMIRPGEFDPASPLIPELQNRFDGTTETCFENQLCLRPLITVAGDQIILDLWFRAASTPDLVPYQLISNPPPPDVYAGPRLLVFAQLLDGENTFITGDDGLWVDEYSLKSGDQFIQRHLLPIPPDSNNAKISFGMYDPLSGLRSLTIDGKDSVRVDLKPTQ